MDLFHLNGTILTTCPRGNAPLLSRELTRLGFPVRSEGPLNVETAGSLGDTMGLNLSLRTGHRVLFHLQSFEAANPKDMYEKVSNLKWEEYIPSSGYLSVHSFVDNQWVTDTRFANLKCKDAIVDRIRSVCGQRPDSGPEQKGVVVFLYWKDDACSIYLDTSGVSLSHRGYRKIPLKAPMRETTAAAVVLATGWDGRGTFVNPMCGSGTLAIEAALIALERPPGLLRGNFAFMNLRDFEKSRWDALRKEARVGAKKNFEGRIIATDVRAAAVKAARRNATTAGVDHLIEFQVCDYADTPVPEGGGAVVLNPEYGERMGMTKDLMAVYKGIGDFFKKRCTGYTGYIFTGNRDLAKKVGLRAKSKQLFFNGNIECRLFEYDLYEGSKKNGKTDKE